MSRVQNLRQQQQVDHSQRETSAANDLPIKNLKIIDQDADDDDDDSSLIVGFPIIPRNKSTSQLRQQPSQASRPCLKKAVSFSPTSTMHKWFVNPDAEGPITSTTWYKKSDYKSFRREVKHEVAFARHISAKKSRQSSSSGDCTAESSQDEESEEDNCESLCHIVTGIEHLLEQETLRQIIELRSSHRNAVLEEQWRQVAIAGCVTQPKDLRSVSKMYSGPSKARAVTYAIGRNARGLSSSDNNLTASFTRVRATAA